MGELMAWIDRFGVTTVLCIYLLVRYDKRLKELRETQEKVALALTQLTTLVGYCTQRGKES